MKEKCKREYEGKDHAYTSKQGYKVPFSTYGSVMVIGRNSQVLNGSDSVMLGITRIKWFLHYEYFKWQSIFTPTILIEGNKFMSDNRIHDFMIKEKMKYEMYYLKVPVEILDKRSKKRANGYDLRIRTKKMVERELCNYNDIITNEKYRKNIKVRNSVNKKRCKMIADEIFGVIKSENSISPS